MSKVIKEIKKNKTEKIIISIDEFKGREYANVRVFFKNDDGEFCPTKKGIALNMDIIPEVVDGLMTILEDMKKADRKDSDKRKKDKNIVVDENEE